MPKEIVKHIKKTLNNNLEVELETLEKESQKSLDDKIIAVCGALLGLSVGFINTFIHTVQKQCVSKIFFFLVILCLGITVASSVYSHYYSACCFRKYNEQQHYNKNLTFNIKDAVKRIKQLNGIQVYAFIFTVIFIVVLLAVFTFTSDDASCNTINQVKYSLQEIHDMTNKKEQSNNQATDIKCQLGDLPPPRMYMGDSLNFTPKMVKLASKEEQSSNKDNDSLNFASKRDDLVTKGIANEIIQNPDTKK